MKAISETRKIYIMLPISSRIAEMFGPHNG